MYKFIYLGFLFLLFNSCFAQLPVLLNEQFNDNTNNWPNNYEEATYECVIKDGGYYIKNKNKEAGTDFACTPKLFDAYKDFEIETKITFLSGSNYGFGIYTGDKRFTKNNKENYFTISQNGYFRINSYSDEKKELIYKEWEETSAIKKSTSTNILSVKKTGSQSSFFINGKLVYTLHDGFWGSEVGFIVYDSITINVDYFSIRQKFDPINVVENKSILKKENLGPNVNSKIQDVTPVISHDGKTLYFSVRSNDTDANGSYDSEIYYSTLNKNGAWDKRKNIGLPLNNKQNNFIISATPDNNSLVLSGQYEEDGTSVEGFSISHRTQNGWSLPEDMMVEDFYNDNDYVSYCLSADRKILLMSIERKDTYGQTDIYVSFQKDDNTWTAPQNLGTDINTYGSEETPFLAADGKSLYFSSNGRPGYGDNDIFMSRRIGDSWTKWSEPLNLGPQINTSSWDAYYTIPASGDYAYLASTDHSIGLTDIFRITVAESAKPEPVVIIHGKVLDKVTKQPLEATIDYHELSTGKDAGSARSNPTDGSYKIILPYGTAYGFLAEKTNFLSESDNIDLTAVKQYIEIERDLYLSPIEIGKAITLNNVFFVRSKAELLPDSHAELDRLVKVLTDNPNLKIEISGYTDNVGDPALNLKLSEDRVATIKNYLINKHISAKRLSGKGYGGSKPIASNSTEETRKLNRRVEFVIVGK